MPVALYFVFRHRACLSFSSMASVTLALLCLTLNMASLLCSHWIHVFLWESYFKTVYLEYSSSVLPYNISQKLGWMLMFLTESHLIECGFQEARWSTYLLLTIYSNISEQNNINECVCLFGISQKPISKFSFEIHSLQQCLPPAPLWGLCS